MSEPIRWRAVTLVLHAHLSRYADDRTHVELPHRAGATIADYVQSLAIPEHEFYAGVRRGVVTRDFRQVPEPGDVIELLPMLSGG